MAKALKHNIEVRCFVTLLHDDFIFHENIRVQLLGYAHDFDLVSDILENSELVFSETMWWEAQCNSIL